MPENVTVTKPGQHQPLTVTVPQSSVTKVQLGNPKPGPALDRPAFQGPAK